VGEWATASYGVGRGNRIELTHELRFPHSLGLLYSAFTAFCGFRVNSGEYKLMGLAPYGEPRYADLIRRELMDLKPDGSFRLNLRYFGFCQGRTMTTPAFNRLFSGPPRGEDQPIGEREMDLAASIQAVTEEVVLRAARHVHQQTGLSNLCLAGGVALNCVANGRLLREGPFENLWIQPAAGDSGGAIGVALHIWHQLLDRPRRPEPSDGQRRSLLGPEFSMGEIRAFLSTVPDEFTEFASDDELCATVADLLAAGKVVGWFQERMEFGPRALGARSILADPRVAAMPSRINERIKGRESFRPFGPAVLAEHAAEYFEMRPCSANPYMLLVAPVRRELRIRSSGPEARGWDRLNEPRSMIPAVTHVDGSARVQTVDAAGGRFRTLLEHFHRVTGCPLLVNTSFNVRDEPLVCSPAEAYRCYQTTELDALVLGYCVLVKQRAQYKSNYDNDRHCDAAS
jgi:carbamoyltransferase